MFCFFSSFMYNFFFIMDADQDIFVIEVESRLQALVLLIEAYRFGMITRQDLIQCLTTLLDN